MIFSGEDTGKVAAFALALWHLGGCASRVRAAKASGANMIVAHSMGLCASRYREARRICCLSQEAQCHGGVPV